MDYKVTTFYKFTPLEESSLEDLRAELLQKCEELKLRGLMLIATEGCNATMSGSQEGIEAFKRVLEEKFGSMFFKDSWSDTQPFRKLKIRIKPEIVALKDTSVSPESDKNNHLSPEEWHKVLSEEDVVLIDARNWYETNIGKFEGALDPKTKKFSELPEFVEKNNIPKDKKVLMYCTGGIRCDKFLVSMQKKGYKDVYQLEGGIINYLEKYPEGHFKGECFIFDERVALDKNLQPSKKYSICSGCGDPGDIKINCKMCDEDCVICGTCQKDEIRNTCSKFCRHQMKVRA